MAGCVMQLYFFGALGSTECYLLAVMSYDRYLAVCRPLHYPTLMHGTICVGLVIGSWFSGFTVAAAFQAAMVTSLTFCGGNEIDHFFCDLKPLQKLFCSDPQLVNLVCMSLTVLVTLAPFGLTLASYWKILAMVLHIPSMTGRQKAFSTSSSHLVVVTLFYGTLVLVYAVPLAGQVPALNKTFSLLYTVVTPMCNPLIYSLKNKDVKEALWKLRIWSYNDEFHSIDKNGGSLKVKALSVLILRELSAWLGKHRIDYNIYEVKYWLIPQIIYLAALGEELVDLSWCPWNYLVFLEHICT